MTPDKDGVSFAAAQSGLRTSRSHHIHHNIMGELKQSWKKEKFFLIQIQKVQYRLDIKSNIHFIFCRRLLVVVFVWIRWGHILWSINREPGCFKDFSYIYLSPVQTYRILSFIFMLPALGSCHMSTLKKHFRHVFQSSPSCTSDRTDRLLFLSICALLYAHTSFNILHKLFCRCVCTVCITECVHTQQPPGCCAGLYQIFQSDFSFVYKHGGCFTYLL